MESFFWATDAEQLADCLWNILRPTETTVRESSTTKKTIGGLRSVNDLEKLPVPETVTRTPTPALICEDNLGIPAIEGNGREKSKLQPTMENQQFVKSEGYFTAVYGTDVDNNEGRTTVLGIYPERNRGQLTVGE